MKKIIVSLIVVALTMMSLVACNTSNGGEKIRIGYMTGPTGMGMAKLIEDNGGIEGSEKYSFEKFTDTGKAKDALLAGNIDMICYPTNDAANYYNNLDKNVQVLAVNTLCSLFLLTSGTDTISSLADLDGKTVYTCKNGTPKQILDYLISATGVNITVSYTYDGKEMLTPALLKDQLIAGGIEYAVAPEPIVTAVCLQNKSYSVALDLGEVWDSVSETELAMGCIIARKDFVASNTAAVKSFLDEYEASIEFISDSKNIDNAAKYIVGCGVMDKEPAAKKALLNLGEAIFYMDGEDMKSALTELYAALGITAPADEFYFND